MTLTKIMMNSMMFLFICLKGYEDIWRICRNNFGTAYNECNIYLPYTGKYYWYFDGIDDLHIFPLIFSCDDIYYQATSVILT